MMEGRIELGDHRVYIVSIAKNAIVTTTKERYTKDLDKNCPTIDGLSIPVQYHKILTH